MLLGISGITVSGQDKSFVSNSDENQQWFDSLSTLPLTGKLEMIKKRLLSDTIMSYRNDIKVDEVYSDEDDVIMCSMKFCIHRKPLLIFDGYSISLDHLSANQTSVLVNIIDEAHISNIRLIKSDEVSTMALYGTKGASGVLVFTLYNKRDLRKIKKIKSLDCY